MMQALQIATNVGTPLALLALMVIVAYYSYARYLTSIEKKLELLPPHQRVKSIDTYLTRYNIDGANLTRDQKLQLIREEMLKNHQQSRSRAGIVVAILFVICFIAACAAYILGIRWIKLGDQPKATTLRLRMDEEMAKNADAPLRGLIPIYYFTLSNPGSGLALVDEIAIDVLDVIEDTASSPEAMVEQYKYEIKLNPDTNGRVPLGLASKFKYSSGEVDQFSIKVSTEKPGYDYFIRFVVKWHDDVLRKDETTVSDIQVARFPSSQMMTPDEIGRKAKEQSARIEQHLNKLRAGLKDG